MNSVGVLFVIVAFVDVQLNVIHAVSILSSVIVALIWIVFPEKMSESIVVEVICGASKSMMLRISKLVADDVFVVE